MNSIHTRARTHTHTHIHTHTHAHLIALQPCFVSASGWSCCVSDTTTAIRSSRVWHHGWNNRRAGVGRKWVWPTPTLTAMGHAATHFTLSIRAQELCESRDVRPGLCVHKSPYGLWGRKATLNLDPVVHGQSSGAVWKSRWTSWAPRP